MRNIEENKIVEELSKKHCKSKKYMLFLFKICKDFNCTNVKEYIDDYLFSVSKGVSKHF